MLNRDNADGVAWGKRSAALAERLGDVDTLAYALNMIGTSYVMAGEIETVLEHGGRITRPLRVVCETSRVGCSTRRTDAEPGEERCVQTTPAPRGDRALEREPRKLVPERDGIAVVAQHTCFDAVVEILQLVGDDRLEQPELCLAGDERHDVEQAPGAGPSGPVRARTASRTVSGRAAVSSARTSVT